MKFKQLCRSYLETRVGTKDGTKSTYKSAINTHMIPLLGNLSVSSMDKSDGVELVSGMEMSNKSSSTINKIIVILKCIASHAVENNIIKVSPFKDIKRMKVDQRNFGYWNEKEAEEFLGKTKDHRLHLLFKFALNTGLRRGELCGLRWKDVKLNEGNTELHFNEQLLPGRIRDLVKGHSSRFVPLSLEAVNILNEIGRKDDNDYIFTLKNGNSVEPNYLSIEFRAIQKEVGIKNSIKFHSLRHSFASLLSAKGVSLQKVQHLLGHKDSKVTERYSHLSQSDLRDTVQIVSFT